VDGSLLDFDHREVRASRCIIANSRQIFLVTDHTKFGRRAMVRLGSLQDIDAIFTDRRPPAPIVAKIGEHGVVLHMVDELADDNVAAMPPAAMPPVAARR
jgi:DeoR family glycerol-3-phosphate regulon repressor